ncbi:MAG: AraC family transcriptional regulator [Alloprevotella sp.]|nr:AraC family transcriptional regulator [Alloprevotella sp.]
MTKDSGTRRKSRINSDLADDLYIRIIQKIGLEKRYADPHYSARQLAKDLDTNPRYVSEVVALHTGGNYNALVNGYRLREARRMLTSARYAAMSVEEVGLACGFASRQAFYVAFHREEQITPLQYREKMKDE